MQPMHVSLRELLTVVFFVALAIASHRFGGVVASVAIALSLIFIIGVTIVACVGVARQRTFAIGFVVSVAVYSVMVYAGRESEMSPYNCRLPTSELLSLLYPSSIRSVVIDRRTGEEVVVKEFDRNDPRFQNRDIVVRREPSSMEFMLLGHTLFSVALGFCGGKFAVWVCESSPNAKL